MMPTNDKLITASEDPIKSVNHLSVKLPPCWTQDIELWLLQCETQFCTHNIQRESTKFDYIILALPPEVIMQLCSFILNLPIDQLYSKLKDKLQRLHTLSNKQRYRQIMWEESLGDEKPSQFLQWMWHLVGSDQVKSAFFKEMFLEKMPSVIQTVLAALPDTNTLTQMATIADWDDGLVLSTTIDFAHVGEYAITVNISQHFTPCADSASSTTGVA